MRVVHGLGVTWRLFTVGENGKQNSGMVNFNPKSRLPFAQFSFEKRPRKPETGVKDEFEDLEHHNRIFDTFMSLVHSLQDHEEPALQRFYIASGNHSTGTTLTETCSFHFRTVHFTTLSKMVNDLCVPVSNAFCPNLSLNHPP